MFEGVGFDLGETLVEYEGVPLDWQREYPRALAAVASLWGGSFTAAQVEAGSAVLRRYNTRLAPRRQEVDGGTVFGELIDALGVPAEDAGLLHDAAGDAFFGAFQRRVRAFADVDVTLAALTAAGTSVGVLTDVPYGMPRRLVLRDLSAAGLDALAPWTLTSVEVGVRKPDAVGFEALARRLRCPARAIVFVGNEEKDVIGAKAAGMTAALVWRGDVPVPSWSQGVTLSSLEQLIPVVLGGDCEVSERLDAEFPILEFDGETEALTEPAIASTATRRLTPQSSPPKVSLMNDAASKAGGRRRRGTSTAGAALTPPAVLPPLPAGDFSAWLRAALAALAEEAPADVPCGSCNACCRTSHFIHVRPEERRTRARLPRELLFPAPGLPPGNLVLAYDEAGRCPMLVDGRCTIYADRPLACRTYDCRVYAATGVPTDREAIAEQARRWRFSYPTADDRERQAAVLAAVRFMYDHPESLPGDAARVQPIRVAVLAIAVHESFVQHEGGAEPRRLPTDAERARVIIAAGEKLFGDG
jgi:FMN phosphatase YigB (HAD superfamily)